MDHSSKLVADRHPRCQSEKRRLVLVNSGEPIEMKLRIKCFTTSVTCSIELRIDGGGVTHHCLQVQRKWETGSAVR